ncbi:MAG: glycoside hydrolase family 88 protein [Lachnospiraceae bacterium]|nr:glycoside hydrolase family 88 protein [Lachnospiraceae bacterium]
MNEQLKRDLGRYVDLLLEKSTAEKPFWNKEVERSGKVNKWNYIDGCMVNAVLSLYDMTREMRYLDFAVSFVNSFIDEEGNVRTYKIEEYNLDNICAAKNLFSLYDLTGDERYRKAMEHFRRQLSDQPRTEEGNFWHKKIYPNQVWLDGLYMAQPFYMTYGNRYEKMGTCPDSIRQFKAVEEHMKDPATGLYYHGYDASKEMYWADPVTGCSKNFWLRSLGWFSLALADTADAIPETLYYEKRYLMDLLKDFVDSLIRFQDESGMFWQVADQGGREGNYLETSGTALIATAILRGVRLGFLPESYAVYGEKAFDGIIERYFSVADDGEINLGGICLVAGLGGANHRDGSYEYYISEPVVENESKGVAPLLMAYMEMLRREKGEKSAL